MNSELLTQEIGTMLTLINAPITWRENDGRTAMVTLKALRLAAIVVAHGHPRCNVLSLPNGGNALVAYCWATTRAGTYSLTLRPSPLISQR